ncbi:MAG: hypothetical protein WCO06_07450 [Candidatus Roizmanbacteria bacterium]
MLGCPWLYLSDHLAHPEKRFVASELTEGHIIQQILNQGTVDYRLGFVIAHIISEFYPSRDKITGKSAIFTILNDLRKTEITFNSHADLLIHLFTNSPNSDYIRELINANNNSLTIMAEGVQCRVFDYPHLVRDDVNLRSISTHST